MPECKFDFIYTDIVNVQLMEELVPLAEGFLELRKEFPEEDFAEFKLRYTANENCDELFSHGF